MIERFLKKKETFLEYCCSLNYLTLLLWISFHTLLCNFYLGSVQSQLYALSFDNTDDAFNQLLIIIYSIALSLGGLSVLILGSILDKVSKNNIIIKIPMQDTIFTKTMNVGRLHSGIIFCKLGWSIIYDLYINSYFKIPNNYIRSLCCFSANDVWH